MQTHFKFSIFGVDVELQEREYSLKDKEEFLLLLNQEEVLWFDPYKNFQKENTCLPDDYLYEIFFDSQDKILAFKKRFDIAFTVSEGISTWQEMLFVKTNNNIILFESIIDAIKETLGKEWEKEYEYKDNWRFANKNSTEEVKEYYNIRRKGCCGFKDVEFMTNNQTYMFGFNFGH